MPQNAAVKPSGAYAVSDHYTLPPAVFEDMKTNGASAMQK